MKIGKFVVGVPYPDSLTGIILGFPHDVSFERQDNAGQLTPTGTTIPTFKAYVHAGEISIKVGAAWEKVGKDGLSYYATTLNLGPLFPQTIYAELRSSDGAGVWSLVMDTPEEKAAYRAKVASEKASASHLTYS